MQLKVYLNYDVHGNSTFPIDFLTSNRYENLNKNGKIEATHCRTCHNLAPLFKCTIVVYKTNCCKLQMCDMKFISTGTAPREMKFSE